MDPTPNIPPTEPCPFCGQQPEIIKHFAQPAWRFLHKCPAIGPIEMDWTNDPVGMVNRWNTCVPYQRKEQEK